MTQYLLGYVTGYELYGTVMNRLQKLKKNCLDVLNVIMRITA